MKISILPLLAIAGCSYVDLGTASRLNGIDFLSTDPAQFAIALSLPDGLGIAPGSTRLTLGASGPEGAAQTMARLIGDTNGAFRVAEADLDELRAVQARIAGWEAVDPEATEGSLAITVGGCRIGDGPAAASRVSVAIRFEADGGFQPLLTQAPLQTILDRASQETLEPCGAIAD